MRDGGSFRDPSGFIFYENGNVFRVINFSYKKNFDHLMNSGLYAELVQKNLLVIKFQNLIFNLLMIENT